MLEPKKRAWIIQEETITEDESQKVQKEQAVQLEIVKEYPKSYIKRLKRIEMYKASSQIVSEASDSVISGLKYRLIGYPYEIYKLAESGLKATGKGLEWLWGVVKEVGGRLMSGNLKPYAVVQTLGGEMDVPSQIGRRIAIAIVSLYYAQKIATRSRGILIIPLAITGYIAYRLLATAEGFIAIKIRELASWIANGWKLPTGVLWAMAGAFAVVSVVYIYFGFMKSYQYKGIRKKYFGWLSLRINTEEEIKQLIAEDRRYSDNS